jgi:hypothetical protein
MEGGFSIAVFDCGCTMHSCCKNARNTRKLNGEGAQKEMQMQQYINKQKMFRSEGLAWCDSTSIYLRIDQLYMK